MAECSHGRCLQERRAIKRELQRWTKNMVFVVGLERVAEELMGKRRWRQYQDTLCKRPRTSPIQQSVSRGTASPHSLSRSRSPSPSDGAPAKPPSRPPTPPSARDWQPTEDLQCCFCDDSGVCLEAATRTASDSDVDDSCSVTSESSGTALALTVPAMSTLEAVSSVAASLTAAAALSGKASAAANPDSAGPGAAALSSPQPPAASPSTSPSAHPYLPLVAAAAAAGVPPQAWYMQAAIAAAAAASGGGGDSPKADMASGEMPLDLSAKALLSIDRDALRVPDSKNIFKARPRQGAAMAQRRSYTEDELQAALRDIQSGKLGTRRAAVIYGIPRSTLRNKVYKLSMERKCDPGLSLLAARTVPDEEVGALSGGEDDADRLPGSLASARLAPTPDSLRLLLQQSRETGFPAAYGPDLSSIDYQTLTRLLASAGEPPPTAGVSAGTSPADFLAKFQSPHVAEILSRVVAASERHVQNGAASAEDGKRTPDLAGGQSNDDRTSSPINVILKIPSYKPTGKSNGDGPQLPLPLPATLGVARACSSSSSSSSSSTSSVVALGESSQRAGTGASSPPAASLGAAGGASATITAGLAASPPHLGIGAKLKLPIKLPSAGQIRLQYPTSPSVIKCATNNSHQNHHLGGSPGNSGGNTPGSVGGKGTRPKRGKYRNYDRDALNEAVKAVQRGEMSVHRAGSYYGVPHSTLEYKVKERHLMRPRKRDPKPLDDPLKTKEAAVQRLGVDKLPGVPGTSKPVMNPAAATTSSASPQNGLKDRFQRFEQAARLGSLGYSVGHFPFWHGGNFPGLPIEFASAFPNAERLFASPVMQRLQGDDPRGAAAAAAAVAAAAAAAGVPDSAAAAAALALGKTTREVAESLYDGSGANGSFLDGIIRSSLDTGLPREANGAGALLDQLYRLKSRSSPPLPVRTPGLGLSSIGIPLPERSPSRTPEDQGRDSPASVHGDRDHANDPTASDASARSPAERAASRSPSPSPSPSPAPCLTTTTTSSRLSPSPPLVSNQDDNSACDTIPISEAREPFT